ncbi:MAG: hypothetical protein ACLFTH_00370 [Candidatus Woesearchaeota archaeon]
MVETCVIAYGGSILIPGDEYDSRAIERLGDLARAHPDKRFIIIIGGGKLCRNVQAASEDSIGKVIPDSASRNLALDEIGIAVTKINARTVIEKLDIDLGPGVVYPEYIDDPETLPDTTRPIIIASGFRPGVTTDYCMMRFAELSGADSAIKISNFPVVLDVIPAEFDKELVGAYNKLERMTWPEMTALVGDEAVAGGNYPLDPPAAHLGKRLSEQTDFTLKIGGIKELESMIEGEDFYGTTVRGM